MVAQLDGPYKQSGLGRTTVRLASWALFEGRPLTTRGRWVNPAVLALHSIHKSLPAIGRTRAPIFIMGMGRSGTTLLGKLLSTHRQVGFLNEPKALWHSAIGDEDVIGSYSRGPARYRLTADDADEESIRALHRLTSSYLFWVRRERLLDKNPEVVYRVPFVRQVFPDARFVLLARNGWSVSRSVARWSRNTSAEYPWADPRLVGSGPTQIPAHDRAARRSEPDLAGHIEALATLEDQHQMAALEWVLAMHYGLRELSGSPQSVRVVHYESLLADPRTELRDLMDWCELPEDPAVLSYADTVVRDTPRPEPFDLHPALSGPFLKALDELGYEPDGSRR